MAHDKKGSMTVQEAGRKGGEATSKELHGTGFYKEIGHQGGDTAARNQHKGQYAEHGKKGGKSQATASSSKSQRTDDIHDKKDDNEQEEGWLDKLF